jgi:hypothetical protein|tara:strand:- start:413 stop:550 length:138 start_codon:yes stop_codon:yes gene_type:complete
MDFIAFETPAFRGFAINENAQQEDNTQSDVVAVYYTYFQNFMIYS